VAVELIGFAAKVGIAEAGLVGRPAPEVMLTKPGSGLISSSGELSSMLFRVTGCSLTLLPDFSPTDVRRFGMAALADSGLLG
jgi:hypothetical protein